MKSKKTLLLILVVLLLLVLIGYFLWRFVFSKSTPNGQNNSSTVTITLPVDNFIYCRVDGTEMLFDKMVEANEKISSTVVVLSSSDGKGGGVYLTLPKNKTGVLANTADGQLDDDLQPKIHLSTYENDESRSFENNYVDDSGDYSTVTVAEYGAKIAGTFSGKLSELNSDGWISGSKKSITNCRFSVSTIVR